MYPSLLPSCLDPASLASWSSAPLPNRKTKDIEAGVKDTLGRGCGLRANATRANAVNVVNRTKGEREFEARRPLIRFRQPGTVHTKTSFLVVSNGS
jgi:hypothetical protein